MCARVDPVAQHGGGGGELDARVHALALGSVLGACAPRRARRPRRGGATVSVRYSSPCALSRARGARAPPRAARRRRRRSTSSPRGSRARSGARVPRLDDRPQRAVAVADDAAVRAGLERARTRGPSPPRPRSGASRRARRASSLVSSGGVAGRGRARRRRSRRALARAAAAASPVPRGSSWTATSTPVVDASRASGEATTTSGSGAELRARPRSPSRRARRPSSGWRCFGVDERMRVPSPAAMTTAASRRIDHGSDGWGARIRTWDRGTKTRCLTTWLRPIGGRSFRPAVVRTGTGSAIHGEDRRRGPARSQPRRTREDARPPRRAPARRAAIQAIWYGRCRTSASRPADRVEAR